MTLDEAEVDGGAPKYGLEQDNEIDREGYVHAVDGPGQGAALDFAHVERHKTAVLR